MASHTDVCVGATSSQSNQTTMTSSVKEPSALLCPITQQVFVHPVFIPETGNTYEKSAILKYWKSLGGVAKDPLNNLTLKSARVYTNWTKKREVQDFLTENPEYIPKLVFSEGISSELFLCSSIRLL